MEVIDINCGILVAFVVCGTVTLKLTMVASGLIVIRLPLPTLTCRLIASGALVGGANEGRFNVVGCIVGFGIEFKFGFCWLDGMSGALVALVGVCCTLVAGEFAA